MSILDNIFFLFFSIPLQENFSSVKVHKSIRMVNEKINSLKDLQLQIPRLLEKYGHNQELTRLALANPLLALEKAGIKISPEAKKEIGNHIRFGKDKAAEYNSIQDELKNMTGKDPDDADASSMAEFILGELSGKQEQPGIQQDQQQSKQEIHKAYQDQKGKKKSQPEINRKQLLEALQSLPEKKDDKIIDPLESLKNLHPVIPLLLKKRRLEFEHPAFASEKDEQKIMDFIEKSPMTNVVFRSSRK